MGAKCYSCKICENIRENEDDISIFNFTKKYPIGIGGYGKVSHQTIYKHLNIGVENSIKTKS
jgi:hypothetical protein